MTESESEDEEYDLTNDSQNDEPQPRRIVSAADQPWSSGASVATCTEVIPVLETSTDYYRLSLFHRVIQRHSFAF